MKVPFTNCYCNGHPWQSFRPQPSYKWMYLHIYSTEEKVWKYTFVTKETYFLLEKCFQVTSLWFNPFGYDILITWFQKYPSISTPRRHIGNFKGEGVSKGKNVQRKERSYTGIFGGRRGFKYNILRKTLFLWGRGYG